MLTASQIMGKIRTGENSGVELKEIYLNGKKIVAPRRDSLSDEIAAFANRSGGVLIFGVADETYEIIGVEQSDISTLVNFISEICHDSIEPSIVDFYVDDVLVTDELGEKKYLVYTEVGRSLWVHESSNGYFYRHGNTKRKMTPDQLIRVYQSRSQLRVNPFDEQVVPNTGLNTLDKELYMRFVNDEKLASLSQRRLLGHNNDEISATVAGVLMCSSTPDEYIYNSFIQAVFYRGKTKDANFQIDAKDFKGPLDKQIVEAYHFVKQHNQLSARKQIGREERLQYSMKAVFEALVNAVVHRDYSIHGSKIRLFMFADRLELYSPGELANTLTVENLIDNQFTRNELLSRLISELTVNSEIGQQVNRRYFLERRGEGVSIIIHVSEKLSGIKPVYRQSGSELILTIYAAKSLQE